MIAGRKPKPDDQKVTRVPLTQPWREYPEGPPPWCECQGDGCERQHAPKLPGRSGAATRAWWKAIVEMPHVIDWTASEWQVAFATARIHAAFMRGELGRAQELRVRETKMGMTEEGRRDLRIRYLPSAKAEAPTEERARVSDFAAERRRRLMDAE